MSDPASTTRPPSSGQIAEAATWPSVDAILQRPLSLPRWMGWRLRALMLIMVTGLTVLLGVAAWLAAGPRFPISMGVTPAGDVQLHAADYPTLRKLEGLVLLGMDMDALDASGQAHTHHAPVEPLALHPSGRWLITQAEREHLAKLHQAMAPIHDNWSSIGVVVRLQLRRAAEESVLIAPRGWSGITPAFWALGVLSLLLLGVGSVVMLAKPAWRNLAFAILAWCQAGQLMLMAIETNLEIFTPLWLLTFDTQARVAFDLASAAALVQMALLQQRPLARWPLYAAVAWFTAGAIWFVWHDTAWPHAWWLLQAGCTALALMAIAVASLAQRRAPHPLNLVMRRLLLIASFTWIVLTLAMWRGAVRPDLCQQLATYGVITWEVFVTSLVLITPYLSRSRQLLQEFTLLAASGTIAASLDLLFVAMFSLGQFTSMTLSLFLSLGLYLSFRRWVLARLPRPDEVSMEHVFQELYRIARQVEHRPEDLQQSVERLLRDLFDPLEIHQARGPLRRVSLRGNGAALLVPLPRRQQTDREATVLVLKHARKGQNLFTAEDARLAQRIMEQLHRALTFDQAVEQGRSEERLRIAQDLHDDIGARLLTLMYQAPTPEIEEYIRHTIQDLKTLTRGLAAESHTLSEAAGEWKRDLSHRLGVAHCELEWQMRLDTDVNLTMVQWSALTRILRELVSNAISHAKARKVAVLIRLEQDGLLLSVTDDGLGKDPESWSHGLGLGGVRKRVKQLGGTVRWTAQLPHGIRCEVVVPYFSGSASGMGSSGSGSGSGSSGGPHSGLPSTFGADSQFSH